MEQNNAEPLFELQVDHESRHHFKEATKWSNFIAIMYIIAFGLLILVFLIAGSALLGSGAYNSQLENMPEGTATNTTMTMIGGIVLILFLIYAGLMLYRFSSYTRRGVEMQDQVSFNHGMKGLRNYFIATGILGAWGILTDLFEIFTSF